MPEVLSLFRASGFVTAIVSGGTTEFLRPWTREVYGIPPNLVVGTNFKMRWAEDRLAILPEIDLIDDGPGKPVGIGRFLGCHPQAAFGNSDGDYEMLASVTGRPGRRLGMIVHHDDAEAE